MALPEPFAAGVERPAAPFPELRDPARKHRLLAVAAGDVAFGDNRATQHYAIADYGHQPRRVQQVPMVGDLPVSLDGQTSQALKGNSDAYNGLLAADS